MKKGLAMRESKRVDRGEIIDPVWSGEDAGRILKERGLKWDNVDVGDQGGLYFELGKRGVAYWDRTHRTLRIYKKEAKMISEIARTIRAKLVAANIPHNWSKREEILKIDPNGVYAVLQRKYIGDYQGLIDNAMDQWNGTVEGLGALGAGAQWWANFKGASEQKMTPEQLDEAIATLENAADLGLEIPSQFFIATDGGREVAVDSEGFEYWRYKGIIIPQAAELVKLAQAMLNDNPDIKYIAIEEDGTIMAGYDAAGELLDDIDIEKDFYFKG